MSDLSDRTHPRARRRERARPAALAGRWLAPVALMGVIYFFSAQPDLSSGLGVFDLIGRKLIHAAEFGLLCFLWWRALRTALAPAPALASALFLAVGYAALDEYHQTFVAGRNGSPVDVAIDALGATAMTGWLARRGRRAPGAAR